MDTKIGWEVLDTFFKSNDHFVTQHHLDSYNYFITTRIPAVIKSLNPVTVLKPDPENLDVIKHRIDIYVGGKNGNALYFDKPTIVDPNTKEHRLLFPNEARMFNYNYISDLYADMIIAYTVRDGEPVEDKLERVKIGSIPIMLHSRLCALHGQPFYVRKEMGECPFDQGGYFIVGGKEKVCVAQERNITNSLFVTKASDPKFSYEAFIRCTSESSSIFPKTIRFHIIGAGQSQVHRRNSIFVQVPHIEKDIPLFILFRLLGIESDKAIVDAICQGETDQGLYHKILEFLRASILEANFAYSQDIAIDYLKNSVALKSRENLFFVIQRNLFPNIESDSFDLKARYLAYVSNELIRVAMGLAPETDRDSYMYKRIGISGFLLGDIFKDYYNQFRVGFRNKLDQQCEFKEWKYQDSLVGFINNTNKNEIFKDAIISNGLTKSLKGSWGPDGVQGIVQDLNRISYIGFLSHLRRVSTPMDPSIKLRRPHQLIGSQFGMVCPSESPDGGSIGLLKNFSILCAVSFDVATTTIKEALAHFPTIVYHDKMAPQHLQNATRLCINNTWVGMVPESISPTVVKWLRLLRRNSLINNLISISWNIYQKRINILTENGRCTRPVFIVDDNARKLAIEVKASKNKFSTWYDMLRGSTLSQEEYDFYFSGYRDPFAIFPKKKSLEEIMAVLETNAAVIEYLDVQETNEALIAMYPADLPNAKYTHCEIHPSSIFSVYTVTVPFANHNAPTRIVFSGAQGKQAIGVYATNFNNRIDTMGYVLHYPQKPLVKTRFCDYTNATSLPNGENLIVAVCSYTGYNQEDSIIVNKRAIEKGMFNLSYFKCYGAEESGENGTGERVMFANKNSLAAMGESFQVKPGRYDKLDENGLPIVGSYITEHDAYLGKFIVETGETGETDNNTNGSSSGNKKLVDRSEIADKTVSGIVDKVVLFRNARGNKEVKIRFRKFRVPELGDKMCLTPDHDVLTTEGWKPIHEITHADKVYVLTKDGTFNFENPTQIYEYECRDETLYNIESRFVDLTVTSNHKMWACSHASSSNQFQLIPASDLYGQNASYSKTAKNPMSTFYQIKLPAFGKVPECKPDMELFLELYAILLSADEVRVVNSIVNIRVALKVIDNLVDLVQLLGYSPLMHNFTCMSINDEQLALFVMNNLPHYESNNKYPKWVWSLNQNQALLLYNCISKITNIDEHQRLALHANCAADCISNCARSPKNQNTYDASMLLKHSVLTPEVHSSQMTEINYTGKVHCLEVPSHVFYVRKNGKGVWTGNSSRHGQKGVCGMIMPHEDMPFTKDGIIPDIIINPHAFPSRMTVGHLIECIMAKTCAMKGCEYDAVPFETHDTESFYSELETKFNMSKTGDEIMYNGRTGEQIATEMFIGPTYYQRLKHMVADKINYRTTGRVMGLTKQPTKGRSNEGGLRIGEMEANAILSHGLSAFIKESFFDRSDKYEFYLDREQNTIAGKNKLNRRIMSPYALKLLIQELQTMAIDPRIITDTDFDADIDKDSVDDDEIPTYDDEACDSDENETLCVF